MMVLLFLSSLHQESVSLQVVLVGVVIKQAIENSNKSMRIVKTKQIGGAKTIPWVLDEVS